jgi:hypothetical protein
VALGECEQVGQVADWTERRDWKPEVVQTLAHRALVLHQRHDVG